MKASLCIFEAFWPSMLLIIPRKGTYVVVLLLLFYVLGAKEGSIEVYTVNYLHSVGLQIG